VTSAGSGREVPLATNVVDRYLGRIGVTADREQLKPTLATLATLQLAHLSTVPFENLDIVNSRPVTTDLAHSVKKVVDDRRGGWCFELNGAFGALLQSLGFDVLRLGAAVLLAGPSTLIDHLCLEVQLDEPWLVDVGFGDSFTRPLRLNQTGPQDGGKATFEFIGSDQGTTLTEHVDGVPEARYRFKRVAHQLSDFDDVSTMLQTNAELHWSQKPFATRLLDDERARVTLLSDRLKFRRDGVETEQQVPAAEWDSELDRWFTMRPPPPSPTAKP